MKAFDAFFVPVTEAHEAWACRFTSCDDLKEWLKWGCEQLNEHARHLATDRTEQMELVLVLVNRSMRGCDNQAAWIEKWTKAIDAFLLFSQMASNLVPKAGVTNQSEQESSVCEPLRVDTCDVVEAAPTQALHNHRAKEETVVNWGRFSPELMPQRCESKSRPPLERKMRPVVRIANYKRTTRAFRVRFQGMEEKHLTFRPKINRKYIRRMCPMLASSGRSRFFRRMQKDIVYRRERILSKQREKERKEKEGLVQSHPKPAIAKGSEKILKNNGLWYESFENRLLRYSHRRAMARQQQRRTSHLRLPTYRLEQICHSLYQQGMEKKRRDNEQQERQMQAIRARSNQAKTSSTSRALLGKRIVEQIEAICDQIQTNRTGNINVVSFVEFSCILLHFGLVPYPKAMWNSNPSGVTMLWHAWTVLSQFEQNSRDYDRSDSSTAKTTLPKELVLKVVKEVTMSDQRASKRWNRLSLPMRQLFNTLRVQYLSRSKCVIVGMNEATGKQQASKSSSKPSKHATVQYSLHGRPVRRHERDLLEQKAVLRQQKLHRMRAAKEVFEMAECTFHPMLMHSTKKQHKHDECHKVLSSEDLERPAFERLYHEATRRQEEMSRRTYEAKKAREESDLKEMAILPSYVNGKSIDERLEALQHGLGKSPLPVNFYKKIEELRYAQEQRVYENMEKEASFVPRSFPKSEDGHTQVLPFNLSTSQRQRRRGKDECPVACNQRIRTRQQVAAALSGIPCWQHDAELRNNGEAPSDAELCVDVHVAPQVTRQLHVSARMDVHDQVDSFALAHGLDAQQRSILEQHVESQLKELVHF